MMKTKFSRNLIKYTFVAILFVLGMYHLLMCLAKLNAFDMNKESLLLFKHVLTRFYHLGWALMAGIGITFTLRKSYNWAWLYIGSKVVYNVLTFIPSVKEALNRSLLDGFYLGLLIIVILLILRNENS